MRAPNLLHAYRHVLESGLDAREKAVLIALLSHYSHERPRPWAGVNRLAALTSLNRQTVMGALTRLQAKGAIHRQHAGNGHRAYYDLGPALAGNLPVPENQSRGRTGTADGPVHQTDSTGPSDGLEPVHETDPKRPREGTQEDTQRESAAEAAPDLTLESQSPKASKGGKAKPRKSSKGWKRFPTTYAVTDEDRAFAESEGVDFEREYAKLLDHEFRATKRDPKAVLRNWIRQAADFRPGNGRGIDAYQAPYHQLVVDEELQRP